ncbi:MAG: serine/threonine-protein kinase [Myxococcota bacterium]
MLNESPPIDVFAPGTILKGQYRLGRRIGFGAYCTVFSAVHTQSGVRVAVKVPTNPNTEVLARFQREIDIHAHLKHPNIVRMYDAGNLGDLHPYLIMEYLEGANLEFVLQQQHTLPDRFTVRIAQEVAAGLGAMHNHGFIHRDLKPSNIFIGRSISSNHATVKIIDFGLSKGLMGRVDIGIDSITELGRVCGTPAYMAPEQILGQNVGPQSDIYALGAIIWEMLTGAAPYPDPDPIKVMVAHVEDALPNLEQSLPRPDYCPPLLRSVLMRSLEKRQENRYPNGSVLFHTLTRVREQLRQNRMASQTPLGY